MKSEKNNKNLSLNCKGRLIDLSTPKVMGILNITPDSFYDGGQFKDSKSILVQTEKLISEGATFVDIGAYSSRPGADFVSENEELHRIIPVVELILKHFPKTLISIDSFRANVIRECVNAGAVISNDISAGHLDDQMLKNFFKYAVVLIFMLSALLTPPDVLTQFLMAGPLIFLYGVSILIAKAFNPAEQPDDEEE